MERSSSSGVKQHLRIKKFYGASENAVKTQICDYACLGVRAGGDRAEEAMGLEASLYQMTYRFSALPYLRKRPILQAACSHQTPMKTYSITPTS